MKDSIVMDQSGDDFDGRAKLNFKGDEPRPTMLEFYFMQMGYLIRIHSEQSEYDLPAKDWNVEADFGDKPNTNAALRFQVGTFDFDKDGTDEIVVGWTKDDGQLKITVIKYFPPKRHEDFGRNGSWQVFGPFTGQFEAFVQDNMIELPYGSHGFATVYGWVKYDFVRTGD